MFEPTFSDTGGSGGLKQMSIPPLLAFCQQSIAEDPTFSPGSCCLTPLPLFPTVISVLFQKYHISVRFFWNSEVNLF